MKSHISRFLAVLLAFSIAGVTELAQAQQTSTPAAQTSAQQQNNTPATTPAQDQTAKPAQDTTQKENNASDPNYVPPAQEVLPNAPSTDQQTSQSQTQNNAQQPLGTAAAKEANTVGGAASKPAGTALAGVKQKQSRGLLIKVGAVLAAGAALGTVYALSRSTSPVPPGAVR